MNTRDYDFWAELKWLYHFKISFYAHGKSFYRKQEGFMQNELSFYEKIARLHAN